MFESINAAPVGFEERWYQSEAEQSIFDYFEGGGRGNPVVAMPTGTGKSVVIANFLRRVYRSWPGQRVMMLTHVKELIEQNAAKLRQVWATAPLGIYSAGLKSRDLMLPITFGGVASVKNVIRQFGHIDLLLIDECHLLGPNDDTMYQLIIAELLAMNPWLKVIGFTATPFRMKQGMITDGGIFTDVCYDLTSYESFNRLIAEGYISPLIPKRTNIEIDVSNVGLIGSEFNNKALNAATDKDEITWAACKEMVELGHNRASWLTFASGVENAEHVAEQLQSFGIVAAASHSKLPAKENDARVEAFKRGEIRCLVNMGKYTTGFDHPPIDLIGMLRATMSPGLWVQMLGRGTRPFGGDHWFPRKLNCLVLDFAGNTRRLGPINDPVIPRKPGKGGGDAPVRICDVCGAYNHAKVRFCCNCGNEFHFESKLVRNAGTEELLRSDAPIVEYFPVSRVLYNLHEKRNRETGELLSPPSIKVSYICGIRMFDEWICIEHGGMAGKKAREWWRQRMGTEPPVTTYEALMQVQQSRVPSKVRVHVNKKYPEVLGYEF
jgi:DNA repair protein RadD